MLFIRFFRNNELKINNKNNCTLPQYIGFK